MKIFILGKRGGSSGIFIAPPGIDAETATSDQLLLDISRNIPQIIIAGSAGNGQIVHYNLTYSPLVLLTSISQLSSLGVGNVRPWGNPTQGTVKSSAQVSSTGAFISTPFGSVGYLIMRLPI